MTGAISDAVLLQILSGGKVEPLTTSGIEELWLAMAAWNQGTDGTLQLWADTDTNGTIVGIDIFDDEVDLGDVGTLGSEFSEFFNAIGRKGWLVLSLIDNNCAVDIDFEVPTTLHDSEVRRRLIASLEVSTTQNPLHEAMKTYATALLSF